MTTAGRAWLTLSATVCVAVLAGSLVNQPIAARERLAPKTSSHDPMPLISRNVPAYANDTCGGQYPASLANDGSYDTQWRTCNVPNSLMPMTIAYDLSGVPATSRGRVIVAWYNDPTTSSYDHNFVGVLRPVGVANDIPSSYTLEGNAAPGGSLPAGGWVSLASVGGNSYHSRQHSLSLAGYNWLRMSVTASDGSPGNQGVFLNLDVHDASRAIEDDWIFYGDSITEAGMAHSSLGVGTWAQLIAAANPGYFPAYESGGIGGTLASDGASRIDTWLSIFPGRYVGLSYGSNDAGSNVPPSSFYDAYSRMVEAVIGAGKIPVIPKIPWSCNATVQANAPALNDRIDALYAAYPQIVRGPDLWAFFQSHPAHLSSDCLHPTNQGYVGYRQQWVSAMSARVYSRGGATPAPTVAPTPAPTVAPTPTPAPPPPFPLPTLPPLF
jgi:lysophospholipase L1-like esterase